MHYENRLFWSRTVRQYPRYFQDPSRVIEFGSLNINGSLRDFFHVTDHVGIDWRPGPCVDVVSLAHEAPFEAETFDTVLSASMLEHDPHWKESLDKMISVMKPEGILVLTWGAARNPRHHPEAAPDGGFHALKAGLVIEALKAAGIYIHVFQYERTLCLDYDDEPFKEAHRVRENPLYGMGETVLIGFKDKAQASGPRILEDLMPEDMP